MANVYGGQANVVVAKQSITFEKAGVTADNTAVIYLADGTLKSYIPGRLINGITSLQKGKGYYWVAKQDMDMDRWVMPLLQQASEGPPMLIFTGESNSGGYAVNADCTTEELAPRPTVQILNNTSLVFENLQIGVNNLIGHTGLPANATHGWENGVAGRMEDGTFIGSPLYLVKTGQGASRIDQWAEGSAYWTTFQTRVDEAIDLITTATGVAPSPYMFFSLGINDAIAGTNIETWKTAVLAHIDKMRAKYGFMPIIMTQFMDTYPTWSAAVRDVAGQRDDVYTVVTNDLPLRDTNHWNYTGMKTMAGRMIDIFLENYAI